jgi:hypothetical protein
MELSRYLTIRILYPKAEHMDDIALTMIDCLYPELKTLSF